jgi:hypothetical protein
MTFSDAVNTWFDKLSSFTKDHDSSLWGMRMWEIAHGMKSGKIKATKTKWNQFFNSMMKSDMLNSGNLIPEFGKFLKDVESGKFDKEFRHKYGGDASFGGGKVSRTSEVFSMFWQSVLYHE